MKTIAILFLSALLFASCADHKTINGISYRPYGIVNEDDCRVDSVHYRIAVDAVVCGVIFSEIIIPPIYVFGYNMWEPICLERDYKKGMNRAK